MCDKSDLQYNQLKRGDEQNSKCEIEKVNCKACNKEVLKTKIIMHIIIKDSDF